MYFSKCFSQNKSRKNIFAQPPLAYGELGRKPDIPGNSRITYLFGLLHFEKQKEMAEMTWAQVQIRMTKEYFESRGMPHVMVLMPIRMTTTTSYFSLAMFLKNNKPGGTVQKSTVYLDSEHYLFLHSLTTSYSKI